MEKYCEKALKALKLSIHSTVEVHDDQWLSEIESTIDHGVRRLRKLDQIDEVISELAATFLKTSFLQVGMSLNRRGQPGVVSLHPSNWRLNRYRTVMYVQNDKQRAAAALHYKRGSK